MGVVSRKEQNYTKSGYSCILWNLDRHTFCPIHLGAKNIKNRIWKYGRLTEWMGTSFPVCLWGAHCSRPPTGVPAGSGKGFARVKSESFFSLEAHGPRLPGPMVFLSIIPQLSLHPDRPIPTHPVMSWTHTLAMPTYHPQAEDSPFLHPRLHSPPLLWVSVLHTLQV